MKDLIRTGIALAILFVAAFGYVQAQEPPVPKTDIDAAKDKGLAALHAASKADKYVFVFFFKSEDERTAQARKIFDGTLAKVADKAEALAINVAIEPDAGLVKHYRVTNAPMPLVLAIAPNGAVTAGLRSNFDEQGLMAAFVSPGLEKSLKALQDGKLVLLCLQNKATKSNKEAMKGVDELKADPKLADTTAVITVDPADEKEAKHMELLGVDAKSGEAQTVILAPPHSILGQLKGETTKTGILATIKAASSSGCGGGGCGSGGCGSGGCGSGGCGSGGCGSGGCK